MLLGRSTREPIDRSSHTESLFDVLRSASNASSASSTALLVAAFTSSSSVPSPSDE